MIQAFTFFRSLFSFRYEKDWLKPVNPNKIPRLDEAKLATYPVGYRYAKSLNS